MYTKVMLTGNMYSYMQSQNHHLILILTLKRKYNFLHFACQEVCNIGLSFVYSQEIQRKLCPVLHTSITFVTTGNLV